jgi:hypothetical protein
MQAGLVALVVEDRGLAAAAADAALAASEEARASAASHDQVGVRVVSFKLFCLILWMHSTV